MQYNLYHITAYYINAVKFTVPSKPHITATTLVRKGQYPCISWGQEFGLPSETLIVDTGATPFS